MLKRCKTCGGTVAIVRSVDVSNNARWVIAESNAANAETITQTNEPVVMTEEHTAAPPDVVRKAVLYRIADIDDECNAAEAEINALREKIHKLTKERGALEIWMEEAYE